jgi:1-acyl-sn-glycerol-3-phosphate acyltransferase
MTPRAAVPLQSPYLATGWTQRVAVALATRIARWYFGIEVRGIENLPASEPCLLCANHNSHVDTFALAVAAQSRASRLVFLAARDYFSQFRFRSRLVRRLICLMPFERGSSLAAAKHNLHMLAACRDAGRIIVLFPEGTRSPDGRMRDFKAGAAMFADKLGLRVVPCRIEGTHEALPKGKIFPRAHPLRLTFGEPLTLAPAAAYETSVQRTARYAQFVAELQLTISELGARREPRKAALTA